MAKWLYDLWNSMEGLTSLITFANWGIAMTLLLGFAFTAIAIKAGSRKDSFSQIEEDKKSQLIADTYKLAGEANERAAVANKAAGEANERAEKEHLERLRLEAQIQPRTLTVGQQSAIGKALHRFAGHHVQVVSYGSDAEGMRLGRQLIAALQSGGLVVFDNTSNLMTLGVGSVATGVQITAPQSEPILAQALVAVLRSEGKLEVIDPVMSSQPDLTLEILLFFRLLV